MDTSEEILFFDTGALRVKGALSRYCNITLQS